jgi:signal transduction histidine kinase
VTFRPPDSGLESLEHRYEAVIRYVPYALVVFPLVLYVLTQSPPLTSLLITVGIAAGAAGWFTWWITLHPGWSGRKALMGIYFAGLIGFAALLTARSPWYAFFTWIGFVHAFAYLSGRWQYVGIVAMALLMGVAEVGGFRRPTPSMIGTYIVLGIANALMVGLFAHLGNRSEVQNQTRKAMIAELAETNHRLEQSLAENAALQVRLVEQATQAGMVGERQRMAREIHDTIAQSLAGIITQLSAAEAVERVGEAGGDRRVRTAERLARDALAEARRSVRAMQPLPLAKAGLPDALTDVAARWSADSGVAALVTITGTTRPLRPDVDPALLRVTQEALSNIAKHAAAVHVWVTLSYMEDEVTLDVRDDGQGFDPDQHYDGGYGLVAMRQRVTELAGELAIESGQDAGTVVSARVPA